MPATASRALVDAVKATGRVPVFCPLDRWGAPIPLDDLAMLWVQTIAGQIPSVVGFHGIVATDATDTVGLRGDANVVASIKPAALDAGAQIDRLTEVAAGVIGAAGLDVLRVEGEPVVVATGVLVRLPYEADTSTFFAYAAAELTGVHTAAHIRPLHPQARLHLTSEQTHSSLHSLERLLILPVGPGFTDEEIGHSVLGIVKSAEYTGWRWVNDRVQAAWYCDWLENRYGSFHEAYRPAFALA